MRDIEHKKYNASTFIEELKTQINDIVNQVLSDNSNCHVTITTDEDLKKKVKRPVTVRKKTEKSVAKNDSVKTGKSDHLHIDDTMIGKPCPVCGNGTIIKGNTAYGCSRWKEGCTFRQPFNKS